MIAARIARQEQAEPAPRRDLIGTLLLGEIEWTDASPWFGAAGLAVTAVVYCCLQGLLP